MIWVMGVLVLAGFCFSSCDRTLDVQTAFPFEVESMPVRKEIALGETAEIRCLLKSEGDFIDTRYTIRYFQPEGEGELRLDGIVFEPNDRYPLKSNSFRLYYTSRSTNRNSSISTSRTTMVSSSSSPLILIISVLSNYFLYSLSE